MCDSLGLVLSNTSPDVFFSDQMTLLSFCFQFPSLFRTTRAGAVELNVIACSRSPLTVSLPRADVLRGERGRGCVKMEVECGGHTAGTTGTIRSWHMQGRILRRAVRGSTRPCLVNTSASRPRRWYRSNVLQLLSLLI